MNAFLGAKVILAEPMSKSQFNEQVKNQRSMLGDNLLEGYHVQYSNPDGSVYDSWSPKDVFERAYRLVSEDEAKLITQ
jgi:hypothetical protein